MSKPGHSTDREPLDQIADRPAALSAANGDTADPGEPVARAPSHEQIARRAYQLFAERGHEPGHEWEDWFRAERGL